MRIPNVHCHTCDKLIFRHPYQLQARSEHFCSRACVYKKKHINFAKRFNDFLDKSSSKNGCWLWKGAILKTGYGRTSIGRRNLSAHRASYELFKGKIPDGMQVCHTCDVRHCVNPDHLFIGNAVKNMSDCSKKGRIAYGTKQHLSSLDEEKIKLIRSMHKKGMTLTKIASLMHVNRTTIARAIKRLTWRHVE